MWLSRLALSAWLTRRCAGTGTRSGGGIRADAALRRRLARGTGPLSPRRGDVRELSPKPVLPQWIGRLPPSSLPYARLIESRFRSRPLLRKIVVCHAACMPRAGSASRWNEVSDFFE
ncbi:hypothetical protein ABD76_10835 [Paenibacillus dendritiformis]|nr:hypothetical protein [Paenibacillus dendritiformis]